MKIKFPKYVVREIFRRVARNAVEKTNSGGLLMNSRCEVCHDDKTRMYLIEKRDGYQIFCHHCNYGAPFQKYLEDLHPEEVDGLQEHIIQAFKDGNLFNTEKLTFKKRIDKEKSYYSATNEKLINYLHINAFPLLTQRTNASHENFRINCIKTFNNRKIPLDIYKDFWCFKSGPYKGYVAIPFFDPKGTNLIEHIQGMRMFKPKDEEEERYCPKYKFVKDSDVGIELKERPFWGTFRLDWDKTVIIAEGTLDAMAFYNGIATCSASLSTAFIDEVRSTFPNRIWAVDNFWIDKAGRRLIARLLQRGERCFIIPQGIKKKDGSDVKDGNDLLDALDVPIIPNEYVLNNIYEGSMGMLRLKMADPELALSGSGFFDVE